MPARTVDLFDDVGIFVESYEVALVEEGTPQTARDYEREALRMAVEFGVVPVKQLSRLRAIVRPSLLTGQGPATAP